MTPVVAAVTGHTGFVGRAVLRALRAQGVDVRPLGREVVDLGAPDTLGERAGPVLAGVDTLYHLAAYIPRDHRDPGEAEACLRVNALGSLALARAAVAAGVRRFVLVSSGNVYRGESRAVVESDALYPSARAPYYLGSKVAAEVYVDHFRQTAQIAVAIARVSSVYGPGMAAAGMVPAFLARLQRGEPLRVQAGGSYRSDLVHVDDVAAGLVALGASAYGGPMNLGSGHAPSTLEVARTLCALSGVDETQIVIEPLTGAAEPGFSALDIGLARRELAYVPRSLRDGLATMVAAR